MKKSYITKNFKPATLETIEIANQIIVEYQAQGFELTVRQLFYQFVARGLIANSERSYKRIIDVVNNGRMAGLIDWKSIIDRTRKVEIPVHFDGPEEILQAVADQFALDKWEGQSNRVEVWIEKEALAGVLASVCPDLDVPYFSCRGYVSQSAQWRAAQRLIGYWNSGSMPHIVHLGDHDPSGIDMTRDIEDRLRTFGVDLEVHRIALNMDQVEEYNPPPNPAKLTDSRIEGYLEKFGEESWELDALEPRLLAELITEKVLSLRDEDLWDERVEEEEDHRETLASIIANYDDVTAWIETKGDQD